MCTSLIIKEVEYVFMVINIFTLPALKMKNGGGVETIRLLTLFLQEKKEKNEEWFIEYIFQINSEVHQVSIKEEQCVHRPRLFLMTRLQSSREALGG